MRHHSIGIAASLSLGLVGPSSTVAGLLDASQVDGLRLQPQTLMSELLRIDSDGSTAATPIDDLNFTWNVGKAFRDLSAAYVTEWAHSTLLYGQAARFIKKSEVEAKVAATTTITEAEKKLIIQKCQTPEVKTLLAPFLAEGYSQPGEKQLQCDNVPISCSKLASFGALNPDRQGLCQLLDVATSKHDKVRPRWSVSAWRFEQLSPDEIERFKKAPQLLIELEPTMVELEMLQLVMLAVETVLIIAHSALWL